ncbi:hypothetical protein QVD17_20647 [Tagetes erecta]|uniref:Protein FAR1-RELATED SEQUENCE n=1 Tax=Tagetes erecta TaxID=13708 RepID=A0AAD8NYE6_TARER|nr:hypothetical protein QVD17_20647 [Tagetes erecta]
MEDIESVKDFETNRIEDIDEEIYNNGSDAETEKINDVDMDFGFANKEANNVTRKVFDTLDDAYSFYNHYALLHGYGICISSGYKNKITNEHYQKKYVCSWIRIESNVHAFVSGDNSHSTYDGTSNAMNTLFRLHNSKDGMPLKCSKKRVFIALLVP